MHRNSAILGITRSKQG